MKSPLRVVLVALFATIFLLAPERGAAVRTATTPKFFDQSIRPLLREYCLQCHSTGKLKGDLDLERFSSLSEVKKHPKIWQGVIEQMSLDEMPPKDKPQPTTAQRRSTGTFRLSRLSAGRDQVKKNDFKISAAMERLSGANSSARFAEGKWRVRSEATPPPPRGHVPRFIRGRTPPMDFQTGAATARREFSRAGRGSRRA